MPNVKYKRTDALSTIEHHDGHSQTPANQRCTGRTSLALKLFQSYRDLKAGNTQKVFLLRFPPPIVILVWCGCGTFLKCRPSLAIYGGCRYMDSSRYPTWYHISFYGLINVDLGIVSSEIVTLYLSCCILHCNALYGSATLCYKGHLA